MSKQQSYVPSRYSMAFNSYSRNELRGVLPVLRSVARSCSIAFRFPVHKVIKAIARIFLLNEIEAIFFAYMIHETNWDIKDKLITQNAVPVRDVVCIATDQPEYKHLILYLMVCTYSVKFFLNEAEHIEHLAEEAGRICPGFKMVFSNWTKKHSHLTKRISLKTLNRVYQQLHQQIRQESPDFNLLVDTILQISPAYNPEKNNKDKKPQRKDPKIQLPETLPRQQPIKLVKTEENSGIEPNPLFSSSRLYDLGGVGLPISEGSNFQVFGGTAKGSSMGPRFGNSVFSSSGVLAGMQNYNLKEDDCEELNLGLQEGKSEENVILREELPEAPTSLLNLSKVNSISDRYLSFKQEASQYPEGTL